MKKYSMRDLNYPPRGLVAIICILLLLLVDNSLHPIRAEAADNANIEVSEPVEPIESIDASDLPEVNTQEESIVTVPEGEPLPAEPPPERQPIFDPTIQLDEIGLPYGVNEYGENELITNPDKNFSGITAFANPPDTVMDVGPNHIVQMVNATQFQVWNKSGNALTGVLNFGGLWPFGDPCRNNASDPIVVFDHLADRWLLSQFSPAGDMCIAISQTPDPTANYFTYRFSMAAFPDYPKFGVWPDGYYMSTYEGSVLGIFVFDRDNMLLGQPAIYIKTSIPAFGAPGVRATRILPSDLDGQPPPAGTPNFFVRTVDNQQNPGTSDRIEVYEATVNWSTQRLFFSRVNTLFPSPFQIMLCNRNGLGVRDCIPQPDTASTVDALSNRPMMQLKYRNFGSYTAMVFNQTIDVSASVSAFSEVAGIRWYELRKSGANWTIQQQGTYAPQPGGGVSEDQLLHRWMGSAAIDKFGNIALGYSITNSDNSNEVFPGIRYTGHRFNDPPGVMAQGEKIIRNGTNSQTGGFGLRWGDYSALTVDPVDDCTFWYTTHVAGIGGMGGRPTQIASFRFDNCAAAGADELAYTPVTPCRIVDTRNTAAGIIGAFAQRNFRVFGSGGAISAQGGNAAGCPSPSGQPLAAHINMVAVNPTGKGNLQAFPLGAGPGAGLSVNYNAIDTNLANAGTVGTVTGAGPDITVTSRFSSAHTAIDVLGYYYPMGDLLYTPVTPCRIVDTRNTAAGIIGAFAQRNFNVFGSAGTISAQGGNAGGCPSPAGQPLAAHINMVAVDPTGKGNLQAFPLGAGPGAGLSVNYNTIDTNLANAGTVGTVTGAGPDITVTSRFSSAHTAIDVLGYYFPTGELIYTPVPPCRIVDTRNTAAGIIGAFEQRNFRVSGSAGNISAQGGNAGGCPSPSGQPLAAHINMVAVNPTGKGNLQAFPLGAGPGAGLSVNYNTIDTNLANAGSVGTVTGAGPDITVTSRFSDAHAVMDVLGYYYPAP